MFSVVHAVAIDPFPYRDPDTLMSIVARGPNNSLAVLSLVGLQACLWPALRATRVKPHDCAAGGVE